MLSWVFPGEGFDVKEDEGPVSQRDPQDRLSEMWEQQVDFMRLLQQERNFPEFPTDLASKKGQKFLKDIRNHLMEELFEAGQHLKNAKSHRATEIPEVDREAYMEELVDALHLYFELVIASGISPEELVEAYLQKGRVNIDRIKNGY
jgi:predicted house-cleaning noncanonical NTP pyrophosphatase (MazG superfamily)